MKNTIYLITIFALVTACKPTVNNQQAEQVSEAIKAVDSNTQATQLNQVVETTTTYAFEAHSNFQAFWIDFKKAVLTNDKEAVAKMTNLPFKDDVADSNNGIEDFKKMYSLTCTDKAAFLNKYDKIFISPTITSIKNDKFEKYDASWEEEPNGSPILKGEYVLNVDTDDNRMHNMAFRKSNGVFKLAYMPYYP